MIRNVIVLLTLSLFTVVASQSEALLIAHYEFETSTTLGLDSAGGDNNGTQQGGDSAFSSASRLGMGSLALDGTGTGLRLDNSVDFQNLTTFTIASFVRPNLNSSTWGGGIEPIGRVFGSVGVDGLNGTAFGDGNGYGFGLLRNGDVSGLRYTSFRVKDYDVSATTLTPPLADDGWAHVALVVTEGAAEFFINGVSVGTDTGENANPTTNPFHIGASGGVSTDSFAGLLDDVRIYDEAVDSATIAGLANPAGSGQQGLLFTIDRDFGTVTRTNNSAFSAQVRGYSLFSDAGRFAAASWLSIADNYDQGNGGATIDPDDEWLEFSAAATDLSEATLGDVTLSNDQVVNLGSPWREGPFEDTDIQAEVLLADGTTVPVVVEFTGNSDQPWKLGDLDFDNDVDLTDYTIYNAGLFATSIDPESTDPYLMGDLDGDLDNDFFDFQLFKNAYIADGGSPAALSVPEPSSLPF